MAQWLNPFSRLLHWDCWEISYQHLRQPIWNQDIKWSFGSSCLAALWVTNHWWFCSKCWHPRSPRIKHQGKQHSKESRLVVLIALYLHQLSMLWLGQVNLDASKIQFVCRLIVIWFTVLIFTVICSPELALKTCWCPRVVLRGSTGSWGVGNVSFLEVPMMMPKASTVVSTVLCNLVEGARIARGRWIASGPPLRWCDPYTIQLLLPVKIHPWFCFRPQLKAESEDSNIFQSISYLPASYGEVLYDVCISSRIRAKVFANMINIGLGPTRPMHGDLGKWRASTLHLITPLADSVRSANTKCLTLRNVMNDYRGSQLQSLGTLCHHASPYNVFEPLRHVVHFPCWDMTNWARTMDHEKYQKYQNTFIHSDVPRRCGEGSAVWWFLPGAQGRALAVLNVLNRFRRCACKPQILESLRLQLLC